MKTDVKIAALKKVDSDLIFRRIPKCLKSYFSIEKSVVNTSLSNIGMILHCAPVLMNIGWIENPKVDFKYYYDGISETIANFVEKMDAETSRLGYSKKMAHQNAGSCICTGNGCKSLYRTGRCCFNPAAGLLSVFRSD